MIDTHPPRPTRALVCAGLLLLAACSSSSSDDDKKGPTFTTTFVAPHDMDLVGGQKKAEYKNEVTLDYTLTDAVPVTGTVTDGALNPLVGVRVSFAPSASAPALDWDVTDGSGDYAVALKPGTWVARVEAAGENGTHTFGDLDVPEFGTTIDLMFPAATAITGTVYETGGPAIPGATLVFTGQSTGAVVAVVADGAGDYAADLPADTYDVVVTPSGGSATTHLAEVMHGVVVATPGAMDFDLDAGATVSGTVLDDLGSPLLDAATVWVELPEGSDYVAPASTTASASDGSYSIGPVPLGSVTFVVAPSSDTGFPEQEVPHTISSSGAVTEDLMLVAGVVVQGTVLEDDGVTGADCTVQFVPADGDLRTQAVATDGAGDWTVSVFPGDYEVVRTPNDPGDLQLPESEMVTITAATTLDATLTAGVVLQGTVLEPDGGTPASDVHVALAGVPTSSDTTDALGGYSFLAPVGTFDLVLTGTTERWMYTPLEDVTGVVVTAPGPVTQDVTLSLSTTGSTVVTGMVFAPDGTTPVADVEVTARDEQGDILGRTYTATDGSYTLPID